MANSNHLSSASKGATSFIQEFKEFAIKGNVIDLAVAVVIGAAFGKVITAVVEGFINPLIGLALPNVDSLAAWKIGEFGVGAILAQLINFFAVALVIFLVIKKLLGAIQNLHKKEQAEAPAPTPDPQVVLLTEIRDLLRDK